MIESKKCVCGKTKNADGNCDGSHDAKTNGAENSKAVKPIPFNQITIRCIGTVGGNERVKFLLPHIANNSRLKRISGSGFVISDPQYDAKMEAFNKKKPFSENGIAKEPKKQTA